MPAPRLSDMVRGRPEPDPRFVSRVADVALSLPEAREEDAWTGVRWRIRQRTFAHVVALHHADAVERLAELVVESYRLLAPSRLLRELDASGS